MAKRKIKPEELTEFSPLEKAAPVLITEEDNLKNLIQKKPKSNNDGKLVFDSVTGELIIASSETRSNNRNVVIDQIYKDGFFAAA